MKSKLITILTIAILVLAIPITVNAQTNNDIAELEYIDAQVNVFLPRLAAFQGEYYKTNGRYYQALSPFASAPDVPSVPDKIDSSPTDQLESVAYLWDEAALPDLLAWSFRVDNYAAPDGDGYAVTIITTLDGATWQRSVNYGPASEDWRTSDWYKLEEF